MRKFWLAVSVAGIVVTIGGFCSQLAIGEPISSIQADSGDDTCVDFSPGSFNVPEIAGQDTGIQVSARQRDLRSYFGVGRLYDRVDSAVKGEFSASIRRGDPTRNWLVRSSLRVRCETGGMVHTRLYIVVSRDLIPIWIGGVRQDHPTPRQSWSTPWLEIARDIRPGDELSVLATVTIRDPAGRTLEGLATATVK